MKIVIDSNIPFTRGVFEPYAEVVYRDAGQITREDVAGAQALITRTRTRCDAALLEGSDVRIIATATIGTDHIDLPWCGEHGIFVSNASGCNAGGVMNYVFSALYGAAARKSIPLQGATIGILGVGSCGSRVERMARHLGFKVLLYDPLRAEAEGGAEFSDLDTVLAGSDVITMHLPLNDSTRHLADSEFFSKMRFGAFFINAARGGLVVEEDLVRAIPKLGPVIIDAWENEPDVNHTLLNLVDIGTPHIAGYSYQGKMISTSKVVRAVARYFGIKELYDFFPAADVPGLEAVKLDVHGLSQGQIASVLQYNYPIFTDDFMFRMNPSGFAQLRAEYHYRREFYID